MILSHPGLTMLTTKAYLLTMLRSLLRRKQGHDNTLPAGGLQAAFDDQKSVRRAHIRPILEQMAHTNEKVNRTVVVMLVNSGQLHIFHNFACRCDSRGIPFRSFTFIYALDLAAHQLLGVRE